MATIACVAWGDGVEPGPSCALGVAEPAAHSTLPSRHTLMFTQRSFSHSLAALVGITVFVAACSDAPLAPRPGVGAALLSQGSGSGGSGGSGGGSGSGSNSG